MPRALEPFHQCFAVESRDENGEVEDAVVDAPVSADPAKALEALARATPIRARRCVFRFFMVGLMTDKFLRRTGN